MQLGRGIGLGGPSAARLAGQGNLEILFQGLQEGLGRQTVQVAHHPVVVDDLQLALGEADRHEPVVLLLSGMVGIGGFLLGPHAGGGSGPMVAVGHVESIDACGENLCNAGVHGRVGNHPEGVAEAVFIHEIVFRLAGGSLRDDGIQFRVVLVGEENGLDVRILDADMDHAVVLLILAGKLVLLDLAGGVVVRMGAENQSVLGPLAHALGIDIVLFGAVLHQPAFLLPGLEIGYRLVIDRLRMFICDGIEINLRLGDVQERFFTGHLFGLLGVEDIVRGSGHLGDQFPGRTDRRERFNAHHNYLLTWNFVSPVAK